MKPENRIKLNKAVDILHSLHFKSENIMLVGSIALDLQGLLPEKRKAHDVDLIIRMDDQSWRCLKLLEAINSNNTSEYYPECNNIVLNIKDITLNIWKAKGEEKLSGLKDDISGVWIKSAGDILKKKKSYNRVKDVQDINEICKELL